MKDDSLNALFLENYENTEFVYEEDIYDFLKRVANFLKVFMAGDGIAISWTEDGKKRDILGLMDKWGRYMRELIVELFDSFIYGNFLSGSAMTRTLIESYIYLSILIEDQSGKLLGEWFICSLLAGKKYGVKKKKIIYDMIEKICREYGIDYENSCIRFEKGRENEWLTEVIGKKRVSVYDVCQYLKREDIFYDYKSACSFVHGQDMVAKMFPFTLKLKMH